MNTVIKVQNSRDQRAGLPPLATTKKQNVYGKIPLNVLPC